MADHDITLKFDDEALDELETRLDAVESQIERIEASLDRMGERSGEFADQLSQQLQSLEGLFGASE